MELLKNFTLTEGSHKFVFIPYQENMDIRQVLAQTKKQKPHRIVWLKNLFTQSGCEWLDYLAEHINLRVADLRNGDGYITVVATVKELRSIIQNAYKQQLLRQRETENIVEELKAIPTEKALILITTGRLDYTTLEETVLREQFDNTLRKLDDDIPETGFVEYNQGYLRRGSVFQLSDGKRAVAFNGFHLGGETVEQSTAIQAIVMGKDCITDVSESFLWVISDTGMQANQNTVKIHPEYVCKPALVDELFVFYNCFVLMGMNKAYEESFDLDDAVALSAKLYKGVKDIYGEPYILHAFRVLKKMKTPMEQICALLHDTLTVREDVSVNMMFAEGVPLIVLRTVVALTRNPDESLAEYIRRVRTDPLATAVKKSCLLHDMDMSRIKGKPSESDFERKYALQKAYTLLTTKNEETLFV